MLSGINTDFQYKGEIFHVQTEDGGEENPVIITLLFKGGAIYASKRTNYAEILQSIPSKEAIKELMKEQHKSMMRDLKAGIIERVSADIKQDRKAEPSGDNKSIPEHVPQEEAPRVKKSAGKPQRSKPSDKKGLNSLILDNLSKEDKTHE